MITEEITTQTQHENNGFHVETANEWSRRARKRQLPRSLFGEFWLEGELAILFGDTGKGKSVLAMQIAESIARGRRIAPLRMDAGPKTVVYLDLEMNEKQFEMRYAEDHAGGRAKFLHNHYEFSDHCHRVEVDLIGAPKDREAFAEFFAQEVEKIVREREASALIVDNITYLKRSYYGARETLPLVKALKGLKKRVGLSILLLAHTTRREGSRTLGVGDLQASGILSNHMDSIFVIGQSGRDAAGRYIKHVKLRSNMLLYDASHVPTFTLKKIGGNFLGFEYDYFAPEIELLDDIRNEREWKTIEKIKLASDGGASIREIAAEIGLPKTTVHRLLQMWRPPVQTAAADAAAVTAIEPYDPTTSEYYFPGREEYDEASEDPRFDDIYDREGEEFARLRREAYLIDAACAKARQEYLKTGNAPTLVEMLERMRDAEPAAAGSRQEDSPPYEGGVAVPLPSIGTDGVVLSLVENGGGAAETSLVQDGKAEPFRTSNGTAAEAVWLARLKRSTDEYNREIFIEKEDSNGKRMVWYQYDKKGRLHRKERKGTSIISERVE